MITEEAAALLRTAEQLADGVATVAGIDGPRAACLVARQALEVVIVDLLAGGGMADCGGTTRSRLICLAELHRRQPGIGLDARTAWARLSTSCHHHAYELGPTSGEARNLVDDVRRLAASDEA